jgi:hypothetical protein
MLTNKRIAIVFFTMTGIGVALMALVWRVEGIWGSIVGTLAILIVIFALKWLGQVLESTDREKNHIRKLEQNAGFIHKESEQPARGFPVENPKLRKKLLWVFNGLMITGIGIAWIGLQFKWPITTVAIAFPLALWSAMNWSALREKFKPEKPSHDFAVYWGEKPVFRRINVAFGVLMILILVIGTMLTPPPPNAVPMIIGTFAAMMAVLFCQMFYIQFTLQKDAEAWSAGEKRLERVVDASIILLLMAGYPAGKILLPNLIRELHFSLVFAGAGLLLGYFVHEFLKNKFTGFFDGEERKWGILLKIYVGCLILTLSTAAFINFKTAGIHTLSKTYKVTKTSSNYKKTRYLWLEIEGKNKRFEPKQSEWEKLQAGDSTKVLIGTGALGFDYILKFEPMR